MIKLARRLLALMTAVLMLAACGLAEVQEDGGTLIAIVGGEEKIFLEDVQSYAYQLYINGYTESYDDYNFALEYLIKYKALPAVMVRSLGAENILGAEKYEAVVAEAYQYYYDELKAYVDYILMGEEVSETEYAEKFKQAEAEFAEYGMSYDAYVEEYVIGEAFLAYFNGIEFTVSEEEVLDTFDAFVGEDMVLFAEDIEMYEYYTNYYGYEALFTPEGYRGVTHILLNADEQALEAYADAKENGSEADVEAAREKVIASVQETIDAIYARLDAGEAFEALIAEYGQDPGMTGANLENGYPVHEKSVVYVDEFTKGAFSDKLQKPGDVSDPVVSAFGVHIICYLRDIPSGAVELTDQLLAEMTDYCRYLAQENQFDEWVQEYGIEYFFAE